MCLNAVDDVMMFRYRETILSTLMDHQVPVDPLLMNDIDESSNKLEVGIINVQDMFMLLL
jgi:hypothetical protein